MKKTGSPVHRLCRFLSIMPFMFLWACSFDYGEAPQENEDMPDIVMKDVEYVRVRNGDPLVRFMAESAERYEKRQTMELRNFFFEQFEHHGEDINATGQAGVASVELDSGNVRLTENVRLAVDSEDVSIETKSLEWQDKEKLLSGDKGERVDMRRSDGTIFFGYGFFSDVRSRTWGFSEGISGTYIWEDDEDDALEEEQ